jgi:serine protease Do
MKHKLSKYIVFLALSWFSTTIYAHGLPDFTELVEEYSPAVVNISTKGKKSKSSSDSNRSIPKIPGLPEDLNDLFRKFFDEDNLFQEDQRPSKSLGSGFIISEDGYIVTNNHVTKNAGEIIVRLTDRREFIAKLVGADERSDISLLKVEASNLPTVKLGSSSELKVGEWVLAIGSPFGFEHTVTAGIVSAKGRSLPNDTYVPFIQTDVAINPGNSGGPLFNLKGEVVGVNSQIYSRTGGFMGLSFAIPIDVMKNVVDQLKVNGKVARGWLGVLIQDVNRELAESFNMNKPKGALVAKVIPDSPAAAADLKVGDIIVSFDGKQINRSSDLPPIVGSTKINSIVKTVVIRNSKYITLDVKIGELPSDNEIQLSSRKTTLETDNTYTDKRIGLTVIDLTDKQREELGINDGVLVKNVEAGTARDASITKGDLISMINGIEITNVKHFQDIIGDISAKTVPVLVYRNGSPLFLPLRIPAK